MLREENTKPELGSLGMAVSLSQPGGVACLPLLVHRNGCGHSREKQRCAEQQAQPEGERAGAEGGIKRMRVTQTPLSLA